MNNTIKSLSNQEMEKVKDYLINNDFELIDKKNNEMYKKDNVNITIFKNGTLLFQGKAGSEWYEEISLVLNRDTNYKEEDSSINIDSIPLPKIGSDESGKGDFFGPLVVSAVLLKNDGELDFIYSLGVKDSKKLSDKRVIEIAGELKKHIEYDILLVSPAKYNELYSKMSNLNSILGWAHSKAIENLIVKNNEVENIIIDKFCNENVLESLFKKKSYKLNVIQVINAEQDLAVAAASILARSAFIDWLNRYEKRTGINLPKGVNDKVIKTGKTIYGKNGKEGLYEVAKVHFKTFNKVIN